MREETDGLGMLWSSGETAACEEPPLLEDPLADKRTLAARSPNRLRRTPAARRSPVARAPSPPEDPHRQEKSRRAIALEVNG